MELPLSSSHSNPSSSLRIDLYIPDYHGLDARDIALDVTIAHPHVQDCLSHAASTAGAAASISEHTKVVHDGDYCDANGSLLLPVGIDTCGALGESGSKFFRLLASFAASRQNSSPNLELRDLVTRFSFCLEGMQARQVSTRRLPE